jgi:hypothetical protein
MGENVVKDLCLSLVKSESEREIISILRKQGFWDNEDNWKFYGDNENNFSIIGNQQSLPETAIVEKIINSVDAMLMRECLRRGTDPESVKAPENIVKALELFFQISQGSLWNVSRPKRRKLAENICFIATGKKKKPCYSIIDKGEGQSPNKIPQTFLSLSKSNKLRIPFVQGKFNMGGTGVFQFSGHHNLQLVVSKRDPKIAENDDSKDYWGFTIVRREDPKEGRRSSTFTYLVVDGKIPRFKAKTLPLLPGNYPEPYSEPLEWGTFVKLFEYQMPGGLKTNIQFDLYNRICLLLPNVALPVRFFERREGYSGHTLETTMSGLSVRLEEDRRSNLEDGFPASSTLAISNEKMTCKIFAFKKGASKKYRTDEGIIFTINGQTHGHISTTFFNRKSVQMSYLSDSILVIIDCSNFSGRVREDLFMNSRDRLRNGLFKIQIEKELEELLSKHPGLKALRERRRREEIQNRLEDSKPLKEVLEDILKKSPALSALLIPGFKIKTPFDFRGATENEEYRGSKFPTYFKLTLEGVKECHLNSKCRIQYETDVNNDYFQREDLPGDFKLFVDGVESGHSLNLWNGLATLSIDLPKGVKIGDVLTYHSIVTDPTQLDPFEAQFQIRVTKELGRRNGERGERRKPPSDSTGNDRLISSKLSLPQIIEIHQDRWSEFSFDKFSGIDVKDTGEEGYDFYINMDNVFLLSEIKAKDDVNAKLFQERYKYAMVLIGLALLKEDSNEQKQEDVDYDMFEYVSDTTKKLAPIILPMISYLADLEVTE